MPVPVRRWLRRMRGGAQAHLVEAGDGHYYVLKASNNPQHRRILVNEWVASVLLEYLQIAAPPAAVLSVDAAFCAANPEFIIQLGRGHTPIPPGWHFGSRLPGPPDRVAIFDFLPDRLLREIVNPRDFLGVLAFDKWTANGDARQAIFFRAMVRDPVAERPGFVAWMIDHGFVFQGPNWAFFDAPLQGLYPRRSVYEAAHGWDDLEPWVTRIETLPAEVIDQALTGIPRQWIEGEEDAFEALLEKLYARRKRIRVLLEDTVLQPAARLFVNWRR